MELMVDYRPKDVRGGRGKSRKRRKEMWNGGIEMVEKRQNPPLKPLVFRPGFPRLCCELYRLDSHPPPSRIQALSLEQAKREKGHLPSVFPVRILPLFLDFLPPHPSYPFPVTKSRNYARFSAFPPAACKY